MKRTILSFAFLLLLIAGKTVNAQCVGNCTAYTTSSISPSLYTGGGTGVFLGDDQLTSTLPIGFTFNFMCQAKTQFKISSNGFITFNPSEFNSGCCSGQFLPNANTPNDVVAWCWDDMNPSNGGTISYTTIGVAPNRTCIITYSNIPHYGMFNQNTGQIKLMESTDIIEIHNGTVNNGGTQTQGMENAAGSIAYVVSGRNASGWSTAGDAWRFSPVPGNNPSPPSAIAGPTTMCAGEGPFVYSVSAAPGATLYNWNLPPGWTGASTDNTISVTPTSSGVMSVSASYSCGTSNNSTLSVAVNPIPTVNIAPASQSICAGFTGSFAASGATSYSWSNGSTSATIVVSPSVTTTYSVLGTSAGCTNSAMANLTVNPMPTVSVSGENGPMCSGSSAALSASGADNYSWSHNAGNTASVNVTPLSSTSYTVVGTTSLGCSAMAVHFLSVVPNPAVSASGPGTICAGQPANLMAFGASTYSWSNGAQTASNVIMPNATTTLTVTGTTPPNCNGTASLVITVVQNPTLTTTSPATICMGETANLTVSGANTFSWSNGSSSQTIQVMPTNTSTYSVIGYNNSGCTTEATLTVTVFNCQGLKNNSGEDIYVSLYPNPSQGEFTIESNGGMKSVEITDISGRSVYKQQAAAEKLSVNISQLANGVYYVTVRGEAGSKVFRISKQ